MAQYTEMLVDDGGQAWVADMADICSEMERLGWTHDGDGVIYPPAGQDAYSLLCAAVPSLRGGYGSTPLATGDDELPTMTWRQDRGWWTAHEEIIEELDDVIRRRQV